MGLILLLATYLLFSLSLSSTGIPATDVRKYISHRGYVPVRTRAALLNLGA